MPFSIVMDETDGSVSTSANIQYLYALHAIEILRNINVANIDNSVAWQYAKYFHKVWKDDPYSIDEFCKKNPGLVSDFIYFKAINIILQLLNMTKDFSSSIYQLVPIDPQLMNSIIIAFTDCLNNSTDIRTWRELSQTVSNSNTPMFHNTRIIPNHLARIEIVDTTLRGVFNTYSIQQVNYSTSKLKEDYGVHRAEIMDNKLYPCIHMIKSLICSCFSITKYVCDTNCSKFSHYSINYNDIASRNNLLSIDQLALVISLIFHIVIPTTLHPNKLDILFDQVVVKCPEYTSILNTVRKYTHLPYETILQLPNTGICLPHCGSQFTKKSDGLYNKTLYPDNLAERYLVLYEMINSSRDYIL